MATPLATHFKPEALRFLRGIKRHNDREWFEARRAVYEAELKAPMLALIAEINASLAGFAPEHVRDPRKIMMRIYRDVRFSHDKRPYKIHQAAWWARRGMEKTSGGGFYLDIAPEQVTFAAGVYMPERAQLLAVRRWMAENHEEFRKTVRAATRARKGEPAPVTAIEPRLLTRMPKGFPAGHPADELLRASDWGVQSLLPADAALTPSFAKLVIAAFRRMNPVVETLNAAISAAPAAAREPREEAVW